MAMEYCDLGDLNNWLAQRPERRVSEAVALDLTRQIGMPHSPISLSRARVILTSKLACLWV